MLGLLFLGDRRSRRRGGRLRLRILLRCRKILAHPGLEFADALAEASQDALWTADAENGRLTFDERYIPPALDARASPRLAGFISDIIGRAGQRAEELALRAVEATDGGAETFASFLLLQALNKWTPGLAHLEALPGVGHELGDRLS